MIGCVFIVIVSYIKALRCSIKRWMHRINQEKLCSVWLIYAYMKRIVNSHVRYLIWIQDLLFRWTYHTLPLLLSLCLRTHPRVLSFWVLCLQLFFKKNEDIDHFSGTTDTPVLDFWWCLLFVSKQWIPQIHLRWNTCWPLGGKPFRSTCWCTQALVEPL